MAEVYYLLILQGRKTLAEVPEKIREQVKELLIEGGYPVD